MDPKPVDILVVGGSDVETRPLRDELRSRGARVREVATAEEGLRRARESRPDLIILDEPAGEGDVAEEFRVACPDAEMMVLASGASGTPRGIGLGLLLSAVKPVGTGTLLDIVEQTFPGRL